MSSPRAPRRPLLAAALPIAMTLALVACEGGDSSSPGTSAAPSATITDSSLAGTATPTSAAAPTSAAGPTTTLAPTSTVAPTSVPAPTATVAPTTTVAGSPGDGAASPDWTAITSDLLDQVVALARDPSLAAVAELCVPDSPCEQESTTTVEFMIDRGVHAEGGPETRIDSVEYQGTVDGVPLAEALGVTLIVRMTVIAIEPAALVRLDGTIDSSISVDDRLTVGEQYSRTVSLGRTSVGAAWRLSSLGDIG